MNKELAPFKIFKGIESDILLDGNLDYPDEILKSFDFVVSSIHSSLGMDRKKPQQDCSKPLKIHIPRFWAIRPVVALAEEGYPIDHKAIIDACAKFNVVIEINANPWRLDLDWRWVQYAMEKGVKLSINPDAHEMEGYADMRYGVLVGRKGGLTKEMTFNALGLSEMEGYLKERKNKIR